jgi:hypothetical protein
MGILDDAIREHLDLKKRLGADESELKQLEDEAFGPPARPGDEAAPGGEEAQPSDQAEAAEAAPEDAPATAEEPVAPISSEPAAEAAPEPEAIAEPEPVAETEPEAVAEAEPVVEEAEPAPEREPEAAVEETATFTTAEREAIADQPTEFFDQTAGELELDDLDLELDEEFATSEQDVAGGEGEAPSTEHEVFEEGSSAEHEVLEEGSSAEHEVLEPESAEQEIEPEGSAEPATSDEDVLEETPEFLQDSPEDDELWFEQGEPKDFDF